jgi:hypothetical protein
VEFAHNPGMSDTALAAASIDVEVTPERLSLCLPVDEPSWGSPPGLRIAAAVSGMSSVALVAASVYTSTASVLLLLISLLKTIMLAVVILTLNDAARRFRKRLLDARRPIRKLRERIALTLHAVMTNRESLALSTIQFVRADTSPRVSSLIANTAAGEVIVTRHRTERVIASLAETIEEHARRCRASLLVVGIDPDTPEVIPEALQQLRETTDLS